SNRWPVEETGTNSVRPSTMPRMIALRMSKVMHCSGAKSIRAFRPTVPPGQWPWYDAQQFAPDDGMMVPSGAITGWDFFRALLGCAADSRRVGPLSQGPNPL